MLHGGHSRVALVWPKLERNPNGWSCVFSVHLSSFVSVSQISWV